MSIIKRQLEQGIEQLDEWHIKEKQLADKFQIYINNINNMNTPIYAESTGNFEPREQVPAGMHVARCYSMIDLGTQESQWEGQTKQQRKVRLTFELPLELRTFNEEKGEQPMVISREFGLSMHEKASLRQFLENWRGKKFTEDEAKRFDVTALIGKECLLNVTHSEKNGKTYANIATANPMTKGMVCPPQINDTVVLSFEGFSFDVYNNLPKFLQDKVAASPEYGKLQSELAAKARANNVAGNQPQQQQEQIEDDLPF
jgi:hypothetical protein